ncbi:MAG: hypothetical protein KDK59_04815 [Simkania sp.]|nr:hypothetical protein [Simkania sp.]
MFKALLLSILLFCSFGFSSQLSPENKLSPPLITIFETLEISTDAPFETLIAQLKEKCHQTGDRWNFTNRFEDKRDKLIPLLDELGFFQAVHAKNSHYSYAVVLGALRSSVQKRIDFLVEEWQRGIRFDKVVFLTGKRELRPIEECPDLQSETEMMIRVWNQTEMPEALKNLTPIIVDSRPAPGRDRATTESTVYAWLELSPNPGSCLVFSSQPYVSYQDAILRARMPKTFPIETIGAEGGRSLPTSVLMDNLAKWLEWSAPSQN